MDVIGQHDSHRRLPDMHSPWRSQKRHCCICWRMLACVSFHTESETHSEFQTPGPLILSMSSHQQGEDQESSRIVEQKKLFLVHTTKLQSIPRYHLSVSYASLSP
ncbi:hypothetical protein V8G54_000462 [Vigna mungo]|uniref:Uncharacterized protein n=1 Tax=Vigna mungo TaxID=3915 RepID=A0AAQ3S9Z9_VIGMU